MIDCSRELEKYWDEKIKIILKKCRVLFILNTTNDIALEEKSRIKVKNLYEKLNAYFNDKYFWSI